MKDIIYHEDRVDPILNKMHDEVYGMTLSLNNNSKMRDIYNLVVDVADSVKFISFIIFQNEQCHRWNL